LGGAGLRSWRTRIVARCADSNIVESFCITLSP
jgi:hypothetical protein